MSPVSRPGLRHYQKVTDTFKLYAELRPISKDELLTSLNRVFKKFLSEVQPPILNPWKSRLSIGNPLSWLHFTVYAFVKAFIASSPPRYSRHSPSHSRRLRTASSLRPAGFDWTPTRRIEIYHLVFDRRRWGESGKEVSALACDPGVAVSAVAGVMTTQGRGAWTFPLSKLKRS